MLPLRRAALRAFSARPVATSLLSPSTRTLVAYSTPTHKWQQQWSVSKLHRRFLADDVKPVEPTEEEQQKATEVASEAPNAVEKSSIPAEEADAVVDAVLSARAPASEAIDLEEAVADSQDAVQGATSSFSAPMDTVEAATAGARAAAVTKRQGLVGPAGLGESSKDTLYVGNLFFEATEEQLREHFEQFGEIANVRIVYDPRGLSKGFGYIKFTDSEAATQALYARNQEVFQGRRLSVQYHRPRDPSRNVGGSGAFWKPRDPNPPTKTLFIGNMSFEMSDKDLNDLFRDIRNIIDVRVAIDRRSGQPRGFAHADFVDVASATAAKELLAEKEIYGRKLRVDFSKDTRKEIRGDELA